MTLLAWHFLADDGLLRDGVIPPNRSLDCVDDELATAAEKGLTGRSYDNGRKMFGAAACFACHRFGNEGGMTGPDLTLSGGRYSPHDFLDQVINPSKEINEQFAPIIVTKNNGDTLTGVIVNDPIDIVSRVLCQQLSEAFGKVSGIFGRSGRGSWPPPRC